tara:strand:- start:26 stop:373 length:348 start_codon:yes stop_codon:yes gene_type:complete
MIIEVTFEVSESYTAYKNKDSMCFVTSGSSPRNEKDRVVSIPNFYEISTLDSIPEPITNEYTSSVSQSNFPIHENFFDPIQSRVISFYNTSLFYDTPPVDSQLTIKIVSQSLIES